MTERYMWRKQLKEIKKVNSMYSAHDIISWSTKNIKTLPELLQAHKRTSEQPVITSRWCFHEDSTWHSAK